MNTKHFLRAVSVILTLSAAAPACAQGCTGDLTGNGIVDGADLGTILAYWGPRTQDPPSVASDLNGDGLIDGADLGALLASWGPCESTITGITPDQGCIIGGTQITITGIYLGSTSAVTVGGTPATSFTVVNQSTVQATTPAGAAGPADVRVTTAAGMITASQQFTYVPVSVSSIVPSVGSTLGGTSITIRGEYLGTTTSVTIGGMSATALLIVDSNTVTCSAPPGPVGPADVVVVGTKGVTTIPAGFVYQPVPRLIAWGFNGSGQCNAPADLGSIADCSAGAGHVLSLSDRGQVAAWGANRARYDELSNQAVVPPGLPTIAKVSAGGYHSVVLTAAGTVVVWGYNSSGQCDVPQLGLVTDIAAGYYHTSVLLPNGSVRSFGYEYSISGWQNIQGIVKLCSAGYQTLGLRADGSLVAWGWNIYGEGTIPAGLPPIAKACGGNSHAAALSSDGRVFCWGRNNYGQCSVPATLGTVLDLSVAVGGNCTMVLTSSGYVMGWGLQTDGEFNLPPGSGSPRRIIAGGGVPPGANGYRQFSLSLQDSP